MTRTGCLTVQLVSFDTRISRLTTQLDAFDTRLGCLSAQVLPNAGDVSQHN